MNLEGHTQIIAGVLSMFVEKLKISEHMEDISGLVVYMKPAEQNIKK